ncbi:hypothetical protein EI94DRAFT_1795188 [Lactarius quietus]|nr:hypothetical protein EI94DRAFT_1795188 [Lactarius quietus]
MRRFCLTVYLLIFVVLFCYWFDFFGNRDAALHPGTLRHIDALLEDTLRLLLPGLHKNDNFHAYSPMPFKSARKPPLVAPIAVATARAGLSPHLPPQALAPAHDARLVPQSPLLSVPRSLPPALPCPWLCTWALTPADVVSTNTSLMRFVYSSTLHPSPIRDDPRFRLPFVDPRTDVRVVDSRWVTHAASRKRNATDILVLSRAPLPAPAWSYNASKGDWTWLHALRGLEREHAEPLARHLFADVLSRLDYLPTEPDTQRRLLLGAALHSTVSTFLPSLLSNLEKLREHVGHHAILGGKPVLWYGSWFQPVSCAPDHVSTLLSSEPDPRRLLLRLLAQAEAIDNPWSAYYNAQGLAGLFFLGLTELVVPVYMHERLLVELLPKYGILYISSLSTVIPPEVGRTYERAEVWSCIQHVFETPHGTLMGQKFLRDLLGTLSTWDWEDA